LGPLGVATLVICVVALVALMTAPAGASSTPSAESAAGYKRCRGAYTTSGHESRTNPFYRRIRARRTSCRIARSVVQSWIASSYAQSPATAALDLIGRRWGCSSRFHRVGRVGQYQTIKCSRPGGRRVRFRGQP